jgi:hypothetical protein
MEVIFENLTVAELFKRFPTFLGGAEFSWPFSPQLANGSCPEPEESCQKPVFHQVLFQYYLPIYV